MTDLAKKLERHVRRRVEGIVHVKTREGSKMEPPGIGVEVVFRHAIPLRGGMSDETVLAEFTEWIERRGLSA